MLESPLTKLAAVALVSALAVACKKEDPSPTLANSEVKTVTPQRAIEPEEECVQRCQETSGLSGKNEAKLAAIDDCVMEACYDDQPMEDPTVVACDAVGPGKISYGLAERDRCIARSCCAAARDCAGDPACSAHLACVARCNAR